MTRGIPSSPPSPYFHLRLVPLVVFVLSSCSLPMSSGAMTDSGERRPSTSAAVACALDSTRPPPGSPPPVMRHSARRNIVSRRLAAARPNQKGKEALAFCPRGSAGRARAASGHAAIQRVIAACIAHRVAICTQEWPDVGQACDATNGSPTAQKYGILLLLCEKRRKRTSHDE